MSTTVSYGSISIIDVTDKGEFSVYPKSNLPSSVIYNPDQQGTTAYTPNWATENLEITPSVWYAGSQVNNSNVDFTWQRRVGSRPTDSGYHLCRQLLPGRKSVPCLYYLVASRCRCW